MEALNRMRAIAREREGYRVSYVNNPHGWRTYYLISHKNRVVGAACIDNDSEWTIPVSVAEARAWWDADCGCCALQDSGVS